MHALSPPHPILPQAYLPPHQSHLPSPTPPTPSRPYPISPLTTPRLPHLPLTTPHLPPHPIAGKVLIRLAVVSAKDALANHDTPLGAGRHLIFYGPSADLAAAAELGDLTPTPWGEMGCVTLG